MIRNTQFPAPTLRLEVIPGSPRESTSVSVLIEKSDAMSPPCALSVLGGGRFLALGRVPVGEPLSPPLWGCAKLGSHTGDSAAGGSSLALAVGDWVDPPSGPDTGMDASLHNA